MSVYERLCVGECGEVMEVCLWWVCKRAWEFTASVWEIVQVVASLWRFMRSSRRSS